jgi:hypothetical protein
MQLDIFIHMKKTNIYGLDFPNNIYELDFSANMHELDKNGLIAVNKVTVHLVYKTGNATSDKTM